MKKQKNKAQSKLKPTVESNVVTFKAFFSRCVNLGLLRDWEERRVSIFFKNQNLTQKEEFDTYQKMLKKY